MYNLINFSRSVYSAMFWDLQMQALVNRVASAWQKSQGSAGMYRLCWIWWQHTHWWGGG